MAEPNTKGDLFLVTENHTQEVLTLDRTVWVDDTDIKAVEQRSGSDGTPRIVIRLTEAGTKRWGEFTTKYEHKRIGILIKGRLVSAPTIYRRILGSSFEITNFTDSEALALIKKFGATASK